VALNSLAENSVTGRRNAVQFAASSVFGLLQMHPVEAMVAGATGASAVFADNFQQKISPVNKPGVIWHSAQKRALPAVPATLQKLIHHEWFGNSAASSSIDYSTTGIVCISERHDDFEHHLVQLKCIQSLRSALGKKGSTTGTKHLLTVGMECFHRRHQEFLDKYIEVQSYGLRDLKRDTNWDKVWGYDFLHYAPLLTYAKSKNVRIYGLHPSDEMVHSVLSRGLDAVPTSLIKGVESHQPTHYAQYKRIMGLTADAQSNPHYMGIFNRAYLVQCFREEYMAESVSLQVKRYKSHKQGHWTAVLAGENHILGRGGIPSRALRKSAKFLTQGDSVNRGLYTIIPRTIAFPVIANDAPGSSSADYVWFVENDNLQNDKVNASPFGDTPKLAT